MLEIRPLNANDFEDWLPLWKGYLEFYETQLADEVTRFTFNRLVDPSIDMHAALAVNDRGEAIGMVTWLTHPGTWAQSDYVYLEDLFVSQTARSSGAGRALIEYVNDWAKSRGLAKVYWLTAESNKIAQRLYDRIATKTGFIHYQIEE
jgi:GNAT superfamily N-acetyltransferase